MVNSIQPTQLLTSGIRPMVSRSAAKPAGALPADSFADQAGIKPSSYDGYGRAMVLQRFGATDIDHQRYRKITDEKVRRDLEDFMDPDDFQFSTDSKSVRIPRKRIQTPRFVRGGNPTDDDGVGSGDGKDGDKLGQVGKSGKKKGKPGEGEEGEGEGDGAGTEAGEHANEGWSPEISRDDIAKLIKNKCKLPNLLPKGSNAIPQTKIKWTDVHHLGTHDLMKETYLAALKRTTAETAGKDEVPDVEAEMDRILDEGLEIFPTDLRKLTYKIDERPRANAVIFYMIDISGSMGEDKKKLARKSSFYLSSVIQHEFGRINAELRDEIHSKEHFGEGVQEVFITHDTRAEQVSEKEFYGKTTGGGTMISSAYQMLKDFMTTGVQQKDGSVLKFDPTDWNIYAYHYSDGENSSSDNATCIRLLDEMMPNLSSFGLVEIQPGGGYNWGDDFSDVLEEAYGDNHKKVRISKLGSGDSDEFQKMMETNLSERAKGPEGPSDSIEGDD